MPRKAGPDHKTGSLKGSNKTRTAAQNRAAPRRGFTLLELLAVMAVVTILLSLATGSSLGWGRSARIRAAERRVLSDLALARQWSVTHATRTRVDFDNRDGDRGWYALSTAPHGAIFPTNRLPDGVIFTNLSAPHIEFQADGSCIAAGSNEVRLVLMERNRGGGALQTTVTVYRLTGLAAIEH